jgi:phosphoribosyl-AMP cyclohydrolase
MTSIKTAKNWLDQVIFNGDGLLPVIAQDATNGTVLMMAWMNRESLEITVKTNQAVYWSRSRSKLWRKGEESGHIQNVKEILLDCDGDTLLLKVEQIGGIACHTMRPHCFFNKLVLSEKNAGNEEENSPRWVITTAPLKFNDAGPFSK